MIKKINFHFFALLIFCIFFSLFTPEALGQTTGPVTRIHTDWNGYWTANGVTSGTNRPDLENNLIGFEWNGTTYSTGVDDAVLKTKIPSALIQKFRALKIQSLASGSSTYFLQGAFIDGSLANRILNPGLATSGASTTAEVASRLTDGKNGLSLGTGIANIVKNDVFFKVGVNNLNLLGLNDGIPDLIVTQVAQPDGADVFKFVDAAGNLVGNIINIDFSAVQRVGSYSLDLFNSTNGAIAGSFVPQETRDIRILGYDTSAFGVNAGNAAQVDRFVVSFSGNSDCAFIAFNANSLKKAELSLVKKVTSISGCGAAGDLINYSFTVTNTGDVPITDINVTDPLPGLVLTGTQGLSLGANSSSSINFTGVYTITAADVTAGYVTNSAKATGIDPSLNAVEDLSGDAANNDIATVANLLTAPTGITGTTTICNGDSTTLTVSGGNVGAGATVEWFTGSCGGTPAGTGNSITVSPSSNTTYRVRYKSTCNGVTTTCASAAVTVNAKPSIANKALSAICSGGSFTITPANGSDIVPASTAYTWSAPVAAGITGLAAGSGATNISGTLTNTTNAAVNVVYIVTPISPSCTGSTFTVTVTVNPKPSIANVTPSAICSGSAFTVSPTNGSDIVPGSTTYTWALPVAAGITGLAAGTGASNISGTLTNTTNAAINVVYVVTPTGPSCTGSTFTVTVTVNPKPSIANKTPAAICSGTAFTVSPANGTDIVPLNTAYTWPAPVVAGITGLASGTAATNISGTLTNTTNAAINVVYVVTPIGPSCTGSTFTVTVTVNPLPNNVSNGFSATTMCAGDINGPKLVFDAVNGVTFTLPYSITYKNNSNAALYTQSITIDSDVSFTPGDNPTTNTQYTLVSISNATCTRAVLFGDSGADLHIRPIPTAIINGTTSVCVGATSPNITFTNPQTVAITVTYTINSGANQTINVAASTSSIAIASTASSGSFVYNLVSVVYQDTPTCSNTITGQSATVTVNAPPAITAQPSGSSVCETGDTSFTVAASGSGLTYQWQVSTNGGGVFNNLSNTGVYTNVTTATMNITAATIGMNNYQYRCVVTGICAPLAVTSNPAVLNVTTDSGSIRLNGGTPIVSNSSIVYCPSTTATFSIAAVTGATGYNWYVPAGWTVSGDGTTKITVTTGTAAESGPVSVTATNASGSMFCPSRILVTLTNTAPPKLTITKTDPICAVPTGTVTAAAPSVTGSFTYTLIKINVVPEVTVAQNSDGIFTGLAGGDYVVTYQENLGCHSDRSDPVTIVPLVTKIWNGSWSPAGAPSLNDHVVFNADYNESVLVNSCSCTVKSGVDVTIAAGKILNIVNGLTVDTGGILTFENGASLIQNNELKNVNTGNIIYKRTTSAVKDFDYVYWSSPVVGQTLGALSPLSDKYWSWASSGWSAGGAGTVMGEGIGYIARVPRYVTSQDAAFIGTPNNGDVSIAALGAGKSNLIGNPYPSAIDADEFLTVNASVIDDLPVLRLWSHNTARAVNGDGTQLIYASDDYSLLNIGGGTAAGSGGVKPEKNIAAGQSFMVISENDGTSFKFTNSMRIGAEGQNSQFFKQAGTKKAAKIQKNRVWLNLANAEGAFKQLLVGYITGATNGLDKLYDGASPGRYVDFYSIANTTKLTIQSRGLPFDEADEVPLGYKTTIEGPFKITIDETDGFFVNQAVYLEDKMTSTIHNLKTGPYSFATAIGTFDDRFVLRYTNTSKLGTGDAGTKAKGFFVSVKNRQIKVNSFDQTLTAVKVYDLKGSLLYDKNKVNKNEFIIDTLTASDQFMVVMVQLEDGKWVSEEIIFHE